MKIYNFKESNVKIAEKQPEYMTLPAYKTKDGMVVSCWKTNFFERVKFLFTGKIWVSILTFDNPLQPQKIEIKKPKFSPHQKD